MTTKIGLIGCGGIAEEHIKGYLKVVEDARITAVCDVFEEHARRRSAQVGGARIFSDYRAMLAWSEVDAVDICLPHHLHKDAIVAAASAGKHILCEKPLCLTLEEAVSVRRAVAENEVTLMCAHNQLFVPAVQRARQLLDEEILGKVYALRTTDAFYHDLKLENIGWRGQRELIGGGELIDTGYHPSYLLLYLAGSRPVEVTAMISNHRLHFMDGEDSTQMLVRFADGSVGNIVTSWAYDLTANTERFSIMAERGNMYCLGDGLYYKVHGSEPVALKFRQVNTYEEEIIAFIACLHAGYKPIHTEIDGSNVLKMILGAYQSEAEKRTVLL
jgi:predicted dehydrogenase